MPSRLAFLFLVVALAPAARAQDRLKTMPGYEQYTKMASQVFGAVKSGALAVSWEDGGQAFEYSHDGKKFHYDLATKSTKEIGKADASGPVRPGGGRRGGGGGPARGRQFDSATSPDGRLKAFLKDRNLWLGDAKGGNEIALTTDGSEKARIKNAVASWVYGEELFQRTAMWWSPDSTRIAYYRFDESQVPDFYLQLAQTNIQSRMDVEPYPKAGAPNPVVDLFVYDVAEKKSLRLDVRDGKPFENDAVGYYVYGVSWSAENKELLFHRTNRRQNIMELAAADPQTGKCRSIVHEEWLPSWVENSPPMRFLKDNRRFIWESERTGWKNFYLYDLTGKLLATLTNHAFEVANIVRVDEEAGLLYYLARDGDNPMKLQLHRVGMDGRGDCRLTDPAFHHAVDVAPDGKHFIDVAQTHDSPPRTQLCAADGKVVAELASSDTAKFDKLGLKSVELFRFKADDEQTDLYGLLYFPSNFDAKKKYPLLVQVYAGPATNGARETFASVPMNPMEMARSPSVLAEYGFLVATLDSRSAAGRGKKFLDAIYMKLGVVEVDDQAAGVKTLRERPYVDGSRVGIFGGSYGGYASILCLLRHPDVFQAACASSPVTDYRHYDTIYTERYMWLPQENKAAYDAGSAITHADKLKGRLMLYYGTADNNVHPNNSMQLIRALQRAGKSFDVQVGPDIGHSAISQPRMMEFFIENLVQRPQS